MEIKQILELMGYCYYALMKLDKAQYIYQVLIINDESDFCSWDITLGKNQVGN